MHSNAVQALAGVTISALRYGNRILGYIKRLILLELSFCTEESSHFNLV